MALIVTAFAQDQRLSSPTSIKARVQDQWFSGSNAGKFADRLISEVARLG
jgi:hypothetical protein